MLIRDTESLPAALWLTAGSLPREGLILQLKVRKVSRAADRAGADGAWCCYVPASGAVTVRAEGEAEAGREGDSRPGSLE